MCQYLTVKSNVLYLGVVVHAYSACTSEAEEGEWPGVQGQSVVHNDVQPNQICIVRLCLKKQKTQI